MQLTDLHVQLKKLLIVIIATIALFGQSCKTTQTATNQNNEAKIERKTDITTSSEQTIDMATTTTIDKQLRENETLKEKITETTWSEPDSTGKQYPTKTTTTERERTWDSDGVSSTVMNETKDESNVNRTIDKSQVDENVKNETETETTVKVGTPSWVIWSVILIILSVLVVALLILKRFGLI